ncbi:MAG: aminotransferase class V-fold PLP-dependent enzyme [Rhodothermales bacterium]
MPLPSPMLSCQKSLFNLPADIHYLNCAYMSPLMRDVEEAGIAGMRMKRAPHVVQPADFFETAGAVRGLFAGLIGAAEPERIALAGSASYGIATAARNLPVGEGQTIVVLEEQFPSNIYSWRRLASERRAGVVTVDAPPVGDGRGRRWNERVLEAIEARTALVAIPHVHWADGTLFDLEAIGARCRDVGAALVVDGTQSIGALPFDVARIQPDAVVCAGYKWLMGPYSTGVAYFGPRFDDGVPLEENWIGRKNSEQFGGLVRYQDAYQPGAIRYDVGERSNFILLPMLKVALEQVVAWGPAAIQAYDARLMGPFVALARSLGCFVEADDRSAHHLFGLRLPAGVDMDAFAATLRARQISVSVRGTAIRISPHLYNDAADVAALSEALSTTLQAG